jgi:N-acetylglutamate synthase-like GNAT family acetyltransferase
MTNYINIRKATIDDKEFAYQTKKIAFKGYAEKVWGWNEDEQRQLHERRFGSQDFRIIQLSGIDVGIMALSRNADCIKLHQMFILPAYQNRKIGEACVKGIIEEAAVSKLPVRLQVLKVNDRAFAFYQRQGFKRIGENDTHVSMQYFQ